MGVLSDNRAQSIQIGAVLLFAVLIVLFAAYQAFVVPSQNERIEFEHYQGAERDMVDVRSEILQAKTTGEDRFTTVQLGTEFPSRIIARNPPDPSGSIRTTENRTLELVGEVDGTEQTLSEMFDRFEEANRFVEYRPQYSQFTESGTIRYENTVVYNDFSGQNFALSSQRLLREDRISLIPVHRSFQQSGKQNAAVEPIPGTLDIRDVENPTLTVGTELTEDDWEELLADQIAADDDLAEEDITVTDGELTVDLTGTYEVEYAPVGLDRTPKGGARGSGDTEINPASPGDIELVAADWGNPEVTLTFENNADERNSFSRGRFPFYNGGINEVEDIRVRESSRVDETLTIPGEFRDLNPNIELEADSTIDVEIEFVGNPNPQQDFFIVEFRLESGEVATYFVGSDFDNT